MNITFSPVGGRARLTLSKAGDALTGNGETVDFTDLLNGATLPRAAIPCDWIAGDVHRADAPEGEVGELTVPVILPHGPSAPEATRFPAPLEAVPDGEVALPAYDAPPEPEPDPEEAPTEDPVEEPEA